MIFKKEKHFITAIEVETRFNAGEDPLLLSIEKWERIVLNYKAAQKNRFEYLYANTCGLCKQYYKGTSPLSPECCEGCPLLLVERGHCCKSKSLWHECVKPKSQKEFLLNVKQMLASLLQAKELVTKMAEGQGE